MSSEAITPQPPPDPAGLPGLADAGPGPRDARGFFERGLKSAQLGLADKAIEDFEEAAWRDPDDPEVQFNLGTAYLSLGMFEQAVINLSAAIGLSPDMRDAWANRAVAHAALGEDARSDADTAAAVSRGGNADGLGAVIDYVKSRRKPAGRKA